MSTKDLTEFVKAISPNFSYCISVISALIFWILLPVSFLIGAAWAGFKDGFLIGRDWD